ncbi:MAG: formylglycine-generating enzyme family protein, partial [bacterium]|nr:formylglycine-generating enzyme family protein [bacterium]
MEREKKRQKTGEEDMAKLEAARKSSIATGFEQINELRLFEAPNLESITEILAKHERDGEGAKNDTGFENEDQVRRYVSLLDVTSTSTTQPGEMAKPAKGTLEYTMNSRMVSIEAGNVSMEDENGKNSFTAEVSPFLLDKFPVTQDLYEKVLGKEKNQSSFQGGDLPVETVTWFEAVDFCNRLSQSVGLKSVYTIDGEKVNADWQANGYRLPTEAEWEYACKAGTSGDRYGEIDKIAWYDNNSKGSTQGVGKKEPNPWGLYDMLGNVWEWCWDWRGDYPPDNRKDWRGPGKGSSRVLRGGSGRDGA